MEEIVLEDKDLEHLRELYKTAQTTPVIAFTLAAAISGNDMSSIAWNTVRKCMEKLGKKYCFEPTVCSINSKTGVVKRCLL